MTMKANADEMLRLACCMVVKRVPTHEGSPIWCHISGLSWTIFIRESRRPNNNQSEATDNLRWNKVILAAYFPDIVKPDTFIQGKFMHPKSMVSSEISTMLRIISMMLPVTIISLTGYLISPFSMK